jgi:hypothetical protein
MSFPYSGSLRQTAPDKGSAGKCPVVQFSPGDERRANYRLPAMLGPPESIAHEIRMSGKVAVPALLHIDRCGGRSAMPAPNATTAPLIHKTIAVAKKTGKLGFRNDDSQKTLK